MPKNFSNRSCDSLSLRKTLTPGIEKNVLLHQVHKEVHCEGSKTNHQFMDYKILCASTNLWSSNRGEFEDLEATALASFPCASWPGTRLHQLLLLLRRSLSALDRLLLVIQVHQKFLLQPLKGELINPLASETIRTDSRIREIQALTPFNLSPYTDLYMA